MRGRFYTFVASFLVSAPLLVLVLWHYRHSVPSVFWEHPATIIGVFVFAILVNGLLWFRFRRLTEIRSWLVLKIAGNIVFMSVGAAWLLDLWPDMMSHMILVAIVLWALAYGKLIVAYRRKGGAILTPPVSTTVQADKSAGKRSRDSQSSL